VVNVLALYGIDRARLTTRGLGADQPVGDTATEEGRQQNRRVVLVKRT
jgi:outer membrane protein OmpA-like peptidoglycan-associated protein